MRKQITSREQNKKYWQYAAVGIAMFGLAMLFILLFFFAHIKKNEDYKQQQVEHTKTAQNDSDSI